MCRHGLAWNSQCGEQGPHGDAPMRKGCLAKGSHWTGWPSLGDRRGTLGTIHSPRAGSGKSSSIFGLQVVTEGPCSASTGMSCQESGNSHKKGISAWMGKEQRKTSWQQVGGTATTQPPAAPCLPAARSCQHTGSRDLTAHYPQQQIFPKGEQLR